SESVFQEIRDSIDALESQSEPLANETLEAYKAQYDASRKLRRTPHDPIYAMGSDGRKISGSPFVRLTWSELAKEYAQHETSEIEHRLKLLETARRYFERAGRFGNLAPNRRKAVAGYLETDLDDVSWMSFGSMKGAGYFKNFIAKNSEPLGEAVDSIPLHGDVTRQNYEAFLDHFNKAFAGVDRKGGLPTASRLLAMKRPDIFLCVCKPNKRQISGRLEIKHTKLDLSNYWEWVVEPIRASVWYNAAQPNNKVGARIWDNRAAMLDTLFYDP
ncbi:MAG: hypothetical protein ACPGFA_06685, partial [Pikeienuella sp.]